MAASHFHNSYKLNEAPSLATYSCFFGVVTSITLTVSCNRLVQIKYGAFGANATPFLNSKVNGMPNWFPDLVLVPAAKVDPAFMRFLSPLHLHD